MLKYQNLSILFNVLFNCYMENSCELMINCYVFEKFYGYMLFMVVVYVVCRGFFLLWVKDDFVVVVNVVIVYYVW